MHNRAPIVLNCFSRGGSNILWNLFLTHPDVCSPLRETLEIFRAGLRAPRLEGYVVALMSRQPDLFDQWNLQPRKPVPLSVQHYIDARLFAWKLKTLSDEDMKYKYVDESYTEEEVQDTRLVIKNNNGLVFLGDLFREMYPEATFFALVRHPLALYESHKRRGTAWSPEQFASFYRRMTRRMMDDARRLEQYHLVKFEEMIADPVAQMKRLYELANLDFSKVRKIRLKAKPHLRADGGHTTDYHAGRHYWFEPGEVLRMLEPNVNAYQMNRLDDGEQTRLMALTEDARHPLGYE